MFADRENYYAILDILPDATPSEIRQAYFRAKAAYGKDSAAVYSLFDTVETKTMLERIEEAYLVLSSIERRREYDKTHGFFKADDPTALIPKKTPHSKNVFSFTKMEATTDAAQEAAAAIFGTEPLQNSEFTGGTGVTKPTNATPGNELSSTVDSVSNTMQSLTKTMGANSPRLFADTTDYSIPRTLEAHDASGPPSQDYLFTNRSTGLGSLRRIDLIKQHAEDPVMEQAIKTETQFRGPFLKQIREYYGITIDELSDFTKISKNYLHCIESEEFDSLPAAAYLRGFVSQISKALKLSTDKVTSGYMAYYNSVTKNGQN